MKYIIFFFAVLISPRFYCQIDVEIDSLLIDAINSDEFLREFKICMSDCSTINLFDYNNLVERINPIEITKCHKEVAVYNTESIDHPAPNSIVLYRLEKEPQSRYGLYFMQPNTGAALIFSYSIQNGETRLLNVDIGSF